MNRALGRGQFSWVTFGSLRVGGSTGGLKVLVQLEDGVPNCTCSWWLGLPLARLYFGVFSLIFSCLCGLSGDPGAANPRASHLFHSVVKLGTCSSIRVSPRQADWVSSGHHTSYIYSPFYSALCLPFGYYLFPFCVLSLVLYSIQLTWLFMY